MQIDNDIRHEMANEPDPAVIAANLLSTVTVDDEFLLWALVERAKLCQRHLRNVIHSEDTSGAQKKGRSRWSQVREVAPFVHKFVDELTEADLVEIVDRYSEQAAAAFAKGSEYQQMLNDLRESGCATVGEMLAKQIVTV